MLVTCVLFAMAPTALSQLGVVAPGAFDSCPPGGSGGDPTLNEQKNRSTLAGEPVQIHVEDMLRLPTVPPSAGRSRDAWPVTDRDTIAGEERRAVVFVGYIIRAKAEGPESCNCESTSPRDHDVHVYISDDPEGNIAGSAIVEVTPRWRAVHAAWNATNLERLAQSKTRVRISGWLLYDQEHWDMIRSHERGTLWEIHPVTDIQVDTPTGWVDLANRAYD